MTENSQKNVLGLFNYFLKGNSLCDDSKPKKKNFINERLFNDIVEEQLHY